MPRAALALLLALVAHAAWAQNGASAAGTSPTPSALRDLLDERALVDLAVRLDDAVDAKDWTAARAVFADEILVEVSAEGGGPERMAADDLVARWRTNLHLGKASFHLRGNFDATIDGDTARLTSKGYAWNGQPGLSGGDLWEVLGSYAYTFARTPDGWRITTFRFRPSHDRGNRAVPTAQPEEGNR